MADSFAQPEKFAPRASSNVLIGALVAVFALVTFGFDLGGEKHFADESAYFSQSYFAELYAKGDRNSGLWLTYPAYDLPPFPKYLIGSALWVGGYKPATPVDAQRWYQNTSSRSDTPDSLLVARVPMVLIGAIGCVAIYAIGILVSGRALGVLAALLLTMNPLYRMHARRAMSDVPNEAMLLLGLAFLLWAWKRWLSEGSRRLAWLASLAAGCAFGLSILSKFSGAIGLIVAGGWFLLGLALAKRNAIRAEMTVATIAVVAVAACTFILLNPFLTASPGKRLDEPIASVARQSMWERALMMTKLRLKVSADQQVMFPDDALKSAPPKVAVTAVQGFGRFGPLGPPEFDSTVRFDTKQDWGAVGWLPLVAFGALMAWFRGRAQFRSGDAPTAWALLIHFSLALLVVTAYLPMAWDRYFLPIQAPSALVGAVGILAVAEPILRTFRRQPQGNPS